jgi:catechol 2,3-dioxygenase-like lactoylglutathione lyase family enzyme
MRLDNTRLLVTRFPETFAFYKDILGLKVTWGDADSTYASFVFPDGACICLFDRREMAEATGSTALPSEDLAQDRFALVFEIPELDEFVDRAKLAGATLLRDPQDMPDWGIRTAHLRDPDGNLLELMCGMPKDTWSDKLKGEETKQPV